VAPVKSDKMLEGFCPEPLQEVQIAVNSNGHMLFLRLADVEWLEAVDNCVAMHFGKQTHLLRETLAAVAAKLPPDRFLHISSSTLVNRAQIKELQPMLHGRCRVLLHNGTRLTFMRSYLLARHGEPDRAPRRLRRGDPA
jgi:two-component system LytT family response regulator